MTGCFVFGTFLIGLGWVVQRDRAFITPAPPKPCRVFAFLKPGAIRASCFGTLQRRLNFSTSRMMQSQDAGAAWLKPRSAIAKTCRGFLLTFLREEK